MSTALSFPETQPNGYAWLDDEPVFDAEVHLQLEAPESIVSLVELGYDPTEVARKATEMAVSAPFRVLSAEGAAVMLDVCRLLRPFHTPAGERIERVVRGGCYRSRFLRDVCTSPELTAHMTSIYGVDVAPHPMTAHLGHLNYEPTTVGDNVDKWHHDTLPMDFVLMVTDPATLVGGQFEWFHGTKHEAADLSAAGETPPRDRVHQPVFPGPGYAIALHGNMVVHRAAALDEAGERITMVNGYVAVDTTIDDQSRSADLRNIDDPEFLYTEWAKFAAWRSAGRLQDVVNNLPLGVDAETAATQLEAAIADAQRAVDEMRSPIKTAEHYEK